MSPCDGLSQFASGVTPSISRGPNRVGARLLDDSNLRRSQRGRWSARLGNGLAISRPGHVVDLLEALAVTRPVLDHLHPVEIRTRRIALGPDDERRRFGSGIQRRQIPALGVLRTINQEDAPDSSIIPGQGSSLVESSIDGLFITLPNITATLAQPYTDFTGFGNNKSKVH